MAKAYIVIKNGTAVVDRVGSKAEAEAKATALRDANPEASFEFGKMDKRLYNTVATEKTYSPDEEVY